MASNAKFVLFLIIGTYCVPSPFVASTRLPFPDGFLFGAGTSSHQVEGGFLSDGKKMNLWDHLTNIVHPGMDNANDTCKSYPDFYAEDIKVLKEAGFHLYRFSISWSRLLPDGVYKKGAVNQAGVDYYNRLINLLIQNGIEPVVTIYHFDLPQKIEEDFGGWTNPLIVDFLEDYAYLLFDRFGDRVKWWTTMNEPTMVLHGYENGKILMIAPEKVLRSPANYIVAHNILKAHARIYHLYNDTFRSQQNGKVGISLVGSSYRPKNPKDPEDVKAADEANQFYLGLFAHPIFSKEGDYPEIVRQIVDANSKKEGRRRSRLPVFTEDEIKSLKGSADFFALNHYVTELTSRMNTGLGATQAKYHRRPVTYHCRDANPLDSFGEDLMVINEPFMTPEPSGFREILKYIKDNYQNPPILVTENGYGRDGTNMTKEELIHDDDRVEYYNRYLSALLKAVHEDKCNVIGYSAWTLLDNFEWSRGYAFKYGIVHVDFDLVNRTRTKKASHENFKQIIANKSLEIVD